MNFFENQKSTQSKTLLKRTLLTTALVGFTLSLALISYFTLHNFGLLTNGLIQKGPALLIENTTSLSTEEQARFGLPVRLKIPRINVDSAVEYVGLTSDGAMDVPKERANVAWFNLGPSPGENGSAVIAGHYGIKDGKGSVFDNLHKLSKGDKIYIEDEKGTTTTFVVRENRRYDPKADALDVFSSNDGKAHLNLVTCEGAWNKRTDQYSKRLVVFTDKE